MARTENKKFMPSLQDRWTVTQRLGNQNIHMVMMMMSIIQGGLSSNNEDDDDYDCVWEVSGLWLFAKLPIDDDDDDDNLDERDDNDDDNDDNDDDDEDCFWEVRWIAALCRTADKVEQNLLLIELPN